MLALKCANWFYCARSELSNILAKQTLYIKPKSLHYTYITSNHFDYTLSRSIEADQLITNANFCIEAKTSYRYFLDNTYSIISDYNLPREKAYSVKNSNRIQYPMASYKNRKEEKSEKPNHRRSQNKYHSGRFRRGGVWHEHKCKWCGLYYIHLHPMKFYGHSQ